MKRNIGIDLLREEPAKTCNGIGQTPGVGIKMLTSTCNVFVVCKIIYMNM